jgi:hypothetical protein
MSACLHSAEAVGYDECGAAAAHRNKGQKMKLFVLEDQNVIVFMDNIV